MGIMLAAEIAQRLSGIEIKQFVDQSVLKPLGMNHSALGMGSFQSEQVMPCQVEYSAIESGGGSPGSQLWDWNSKYWRELGAPWGGLQASAPDIARFFDSFMSPSGTIFKTEVTKLMIQNHNPPGLESRGLGFDSGMMENCVNCSDKTFGHTGSTGTIAWADPERDRVCVVLTTLPARALTPHPRQLVSNSISAIPS
jgi:CubicO group peptidase (beta-lactamase class C family)